MGNNINKQLSYTVTFNKPEYNAMYTFVRRESGAFAYGNRSAVDVYVTRGDKTERKESFDTRYDGMVMKDFEAWCVDYLQNAFNPDYEPAWEGPLIPMPGTEGNWGEKHWKE